MRELKVFTHEEFGTVRVILDDGEAWFVGEDVASALGYVNPSKAIKDYVDEKDKLYDESLSSLLTDSESGQRGGVCFINESGLYTLCQIAETIAEKVLPSNNEIM